MKRIKTIGFALILIALIISCNNQKVIVTNDTLHDEIIDNQKDSVITKENVEIEVKEEEPQIEEQPKSVILKAVGDDLIHSSVLKAGEISDTTYNFDALFEVLAEDFREADIAVINQETILGGDFMPYAGYPNFNSPNELGDAIAKAGFDVVLHATNHTLDIGTQGVINCLEYWKSHPEMTVLGINESQEAKDNIKIVESNGIKIAMLNYTYGLNGHILPKGKEYLVNLIDTTLIKNDLQKADSLADFTIIFPHWGIEYVYEPNKEQKNLAKMMIENGADLIIGTHPHVLQPVEWISAKNGNRALCYYSLGNYTSGQKATPRMLGGMAEIKITKCQDSIYIEKADIIPLITHYEWVNGKSTHRTYKLANYTEELEKRHSLNDYDSTFSIKTLKNLAKEILRENINNTINQ